MIFGAFLWIPAFAGMTMAQQGPQLTIETFCASRGYATGSDSIQLVGTIRNTGTTKLEEGAVKARMYLLAGIEYDQGDTSPKLPALEPGAAVTYRWKVTPSSERGGLVASLALQIPGKDPIVRIAAIPHIAALPIIRSDSPVPGLTVRARAGAQPVIENDRIRAPIVQTDSEMPVLFLSARSPAGWHAAAISVPIAEVFSGEGGQMPWWEVFKVEETRATSSPQEAILSLSGRFGIRWRATVDIVARALSSAIEIRLRLAPTRPMRLYGLRLAPLLAGDGSPGFAVQETLPVQQTGTAELNAVHWSDVTAGALRPVEPIFRGWQSSALPPAEGADFRLVASEWKALEAAALMEPGALVQCRARLFALTSSMSVQDALKLIGRPVPAQPISNPRSPK